MGSRWPDLTVEERFWTHVDLDGPLPAVDPAYLAFAGHPFLMLGPCWCWTASTGSHGYGQFNAGGRRIMVAHRFSFESRIGPVPPGLHLDHLCRDPVCVRPSHLEPVTIAENNRRAAWLTLHYCRAGHRRTAENTYQRPDTGDRMCTECLAVARRRRANSCST